ncbi:hypothetical protein GYH30_043308 [Glycine max]|nr:hypothetical protein GYH30_043308 [Glycine max]
MFWIGCTPLLIAFSVFDTVLTRTSHWDCKLNVIRLPRRNRNLFLIFMF